jgi:sec-independent protein translocase protein TatA
MIRTPGPTEILLILLVLVLLFGVENPSSPAASGRALRIFKAETKGLMNERRRQAQDARAEADRRQTWDTQARTTDVTDTTAPQTRPDGER